MAYRILIVDDEEIERKYLKQIIAKYPYEYILAGEAQNGKQAVEIALDKRPDVVIMDIKLPLLDGLEASRIIKKTLKNAVIILNSAFSEFEFAQKAIHYGLDGYLLKPSNEKEIIETIERSLLKLHWETDWKSRSNQFQLTFESYPDEALEMILRSIKIGDLFLLEESARKFRGAFDHTAPEVDQYRLFLINAFFSIMKSVNQIISRQDPASTMGERYFERLMKAVDWAELVNVVNDFLNYTLLLMKSSVNLSNNIVRLVEEYIKDHFKDPISLDLLSETFHFNSNYISRKFHAQKGITILEYLRNTKIDHATFLLEHTELPIHEIATHCGYSNVPHFNRVFKLLKGHPPSYYRKDR